MHWSYRSIVLSHRYNVLIGRVQSWHISNISNNSQKADTSEKSSLNDDDAHDIVCVPTLDKAYCLYLEW